MHSTLQFLRVPIVLLWILLPLSLAAQSSGDIQTVICFKGENQQACFTDEGHPFDLPKEEKLLLEQTLDFPENASSNHEHAYDGRILYFTKYGSLYRWDRINDETITIRDASSSAHYGVYYDGASLSRKGDLLLTTKSNGISVPEVIDTKSLTTVFRVEEEHTMGYWSSDGAVLSVHDQFYRTDNWHPVSWANDVMAKFAPKWLVVSVLDKDILYWTEIVDRQTRLLLFNAGRDTSPRIVFELPHTEEQYEYTPSLILVGATPAGVYFRTGFEIYRCDQNGILTQVASPLDGAPIESTSIYHLKR